MRPVPRKWMRGPADDRAVAAGCTFDAAAGRYACDFIGAFCRQSTGSQWAGKPLELLVWQRDLLMRLFGWRRADGRRRFRRLYCEVAKKNGKSTLISALALYLLLCDDSAPQIYLNACDRGQARIIFDQARLMVEASPDLSRRLQVLEYKHRIVDPKGHGALIANSADVPAKDGLNPSAVIFDELHQQPNSELWDVFAHAGAARLEPLTIAITTAGAREDGIWWEQRDYSERVNRGEVEDVGHLGIIYRADPADDLDDPATWRKANPSLGVTVSEDEFRVQLAEAQQTPRLLAGFKRLRLNIITQADSAFLDPDEWAACGSPRPILALMHGPCYVGIDLSRTTDLTAMVALWGDRDGGFDLAAWFWLPADAVDELARRDRQPYRAWIDAGWIAATPGNVIDYGYIRRDLIGLAAAHDVRKVLIDPFNATQLALDLRDGDGLPVDFLRQGFLSLSDPTKQLELMVKSRKLRHGNNPVLRWMAANAVVETDPAGNLKLSKRRSREKIDGLSALVNATAAASGDDAGAGASVYETRGILSL